MAKISLNRQVCSGHILLKGAMGESVDLFLPPHQEAGSLSDVPHESLGPVKAAAQVGGQPVPQVSGADVGCVPVGP